MPPLTNFGVYLRYITDEAQDNYYKWNILDCSLKECTQNKVNLMNLAYEPQLQNNLKELFSLMGQFKAPSKILLNSAEFNTLDIKGSDYHTKRHSVETVIYALRNTVEENLMDVLSAIDLLLDEV